MRIGISKSFGSFRIGTSFNTKGKGKGLGYLITWPFYLMYYIFLGPFYLMYYMLIWPFVAIYRAITKDNKNTVSTKNKKVNKPVVTTEATGYLKTIQESSKICSETKNPDTFFSRMSLIDETLDKLISCEKSVRFTEEKPSVTKQEFESNRVQLINAFIERYAKDTRIKIYDLKTKSAKLNKANAFYNILNEYSDKMPAESVSKLNELAEQMKSLANQNIE